MQHILHLREMNDHIQHEHEEQKRQLARVLHDELGSALTSLSMHLQSVYHLLPDDDKGKLQRDRIQTSLTSAVQTTRQLQTELRPTMLELFGLKAGIEELLREFGERTDLACHASLPDEDVRLDEKTAIVVYRMLEELLRNVATHAGATRVDVILDVDEDGLALTVRDDGRGIGVLRLHDVAVHGLRGVQERARFLGGELIVKTLPPDEPVAAAPSGKLPGATVCIRLPAVTS